MTLRTAARLGIAVALVVVAGWYARPGQAGQRDPHNPAGQLGRCCASAGRQGNRRGGQLSSSSYERLGGSAWESNPPGMGLPPHNGFEVLCSSSGSVTSCHVLARWFGWQTEGKAHDSRWKAPLPAHYTAASLDKRAREAQRQHSLLDEL